MVMAVLIVAGVAVLITILALAVGMGGEMGGTHPDHPPLSLPERQALAGTDVALLRLPVGLIGYHVSITNEALRRIAAELSERDTRIAVLEQRLVEARERLQQLETAPPPVPGAGEAPAAPYAPEPGSPRERALAPIVPQPASADGDETADDLPSSELPSSEEETW